MFPDAQDIFRFWTRVNREPGQGPDGDCWEWLGAKDSSGYGAIKVKGKKINSHRFVLAVKLGCDLAFEGDACHSCDNKACCNPEHLWQGSRSDNVIDCLQKKLLDDNSSLTLQEILILRYLKPLPLSGRKLAKALSIGYQTLKDIKAGRTWTNLTVEMYQDLLNVFSKTGQTPEKLLMQSIRERSTDVF